MFSKDRHSGRALRGRGMTALTDGGMVTNQRMETAGRYKVLSGEDIDGVPERMRKNKKLSAPVEVTPPDTCALRP